VREPAGIVWTEVMFRRRQAAEDGNAALLDILMRALEAEFPDAVAFEKELWAQTASVIAAPGA
jgi:hypothetical protein